ncbi:MAG: hypothetical protein ACSHWW_12485 [Nonlabens sp.]|uniref:hypothetical protein n=1 Tax=Nonlabens sp. TaxID=1888209 RepID=UPI003EFA8E14
MRHVFLLVILFSSSFLVAQVGISTSTPEAALDITSTDSGFLPPRVSLTGKTDVTTISNPTGAALVNGTLVYNTVTAGTGFNIVYPGYYYWNGTLWAELITTQNTDTYNIPRSAYFRLDSDLPHFLNTTPAGTTQSIPMTEIFNGCGTSDGVTANVAINSAGTQLTFAPGVYRIEFTYEATHNNGVSCTLSSYFVDFPVNNVFASPNHARIHSTAPHLWGGNSYHGGTISIITRITASYAWDIGIGRGASGNCSGPGNTMRELSTFISVERLSD